MKERGFEMEKTEKLVMTIFFVIGCVLIIIGLNMYFNMFNKENKIETRGTITDIDSDNIVYVAYNVDGVEYKSQLEGYSDFFYEGKKIKIYYDKNNPNKIDSKALDTILVACFGIFGIVFSIIGGRRIIW